jgi:hypothetical protein
MPGITDDQPDSENRSSLTDHVSKNLEFQSCAPQYALSLFSHNSGGCCDGCGIHWRSGSGFPSQCHVALLAVNIDVSRQERVVMFSHENFTEFTLANGNVNQQPGRKSQLRQHSE